MPVIVFASSKGGAGKTTAAIVLACELAREGKEKGLSVALVDADPNQHSAAWAGLEGKPENIELFADVTADNILEVLEEAEKTCPFVIVDLEGVASSAVIGALSRASFVVVPCQASQNDAREAVKTVKTIQYAAKVSNRNIDYSVLFTRSSAAILTKTARHLRGELEKANVPMFKTSLIDREAFRNILAFGGGVNDLEASYSGEKVSIQKAVDNANMFAGEVKFKLKNAMQRGVAVNG